MIEIVELTPDALGDLIERITDMDVLKSVFRAIAFTDGLRMLVPVANARREYLLKEKARLAKEDFLTVTS